MTKNMKTNRYHILQKNICNMTQTTTTEKKKQNRPSLRFPDFHDAWEEKKLGEICETISSG
jgi:hypothetical protein